MPSITRDPDNMLFERFRGMERRLQALETRRKSRDVELFAQSTTFQTFVASTPQQLQLGLAAFDTARMLDTATSTITVPSPGYYVFELYLPMVSTAVNGLVSLKANGSTLESSVMGFEQRRQPPFVQAVELAAGDTVTFEIEVYLSNTTVTEVAKLKARHVRGA